MPPVGFFLLLELLWPVAVVVQSAWVDVVVCQIRRALIFIDYKMLPHITQTKVTRLDEAHLLNVTRSLV